MSCEIATEVLPAGFVHVLGLPRREPETKNGLVKLWTWDPADGTGSAKKVWVSGTDIDLKLLKVLKTQGEAEHVRLRLEKELNKFPSCGAKTAKAVLVGKRWVTEDVLGAGLFKQAVKSKAKTKVVKRVEDKIRSFTKEEEEGSTTEEDEPRPRLPRRPKPRRILGPEPEEGSTTEEEEPQRVTEKQLKKVNSQARELAALYEPGFEPPGWSIEQAEQIVRKNGSKTTVFYTRYPTDKRSHSEVLKEARKLTHCREPVNIGMSRYGAIHDQARIERFFGCKAHYGIAAAKALAENRDLPVNIAIYSPATVKVSDKAEPLGTFHFLHSIGCALDDAKQSDYKWFQTVPKANRREAMTSFYDGVLAKIFHCADVKSLKHILLFDVGMVNFAKLYPGEGPALINEVFYPLVAYYADEKYPHIEVVFDVGIRALGYFPNAKFKPFSAEGETPALFVNAWDPWSVVGNGNGNDRSLDGYVGVSSSSAVLCTPQVNPYMEHDSVYVEVPLAK